MIINLTTNNYNYNNVFIRKLAIDVGKPNEVSRLIIYIGNCIILY